MDTSTLTYAAKVDPFSRVNGRRDPTELSSFHFCVNSIGGASFRQLYDVLEAIASREQASFRGDRMLSEADTR